MRRLECSQHTVNLSADSADVNWHIDNLPDNTLTTIAAQASNLHERDSRSDREWRTVLAMFSASLLTCLWSVQSLSLVFLHAKGCPLSVFQYSENPAVELLKLLA